MAHDWLKNTLECVIWLKHLAGCLIGSPPLPPSGERWGGGRGQDSPGIGGRGTQGSKNKNEVKTRNKQNYWTIVFTSKQQASIRLTQMHILIQIYQMKMLPGAQ